MDQANVHADCLEIAAQVSLLALDMLGQIILIGHDQQQRQPLFRRCWCYHHLDTGLAMHLDKRAQHAPQFILFHQKQLDLGEAVDDLQRFTIVVTVVHDVQLPLCFLNPLAQGRDHKAVFINAFLGIKPEKTVLAITTFDFFAKTQIGQALKTVQRTAKFGPFDIDKFAMPKQRKNFFHIQGEGFIGLMEGFEIKFRQTQSFVFFFFKAPDIFSGSVGEAARSDGDIVILLQPIKQCLVFGKLLFLEQFVKFFQHRRTIAVDGQGRSDDGCQCRFKFVNLSFS